ncbi:MAG: response regulator [Desulfobacterales bacterium]|nr:response regulator [Desulfobacterales bacterium]MDD4071449.1 response regulator [Desulfobacterales bacterium]MDD4393219.1 response regulator [Desulfobacterales bacterium]
MMNMLIVDDSSPMRSVIIKTIKLSGFGDSKFFEAPDGLTALNILRENRDIDIVITDYNMPGMNGLELLKEIKIDSMLKSIPVLFVTSEGSHARISSFMQSGAADYLKKPFTPETAKKKLNHIFGKRPYDSIVESGTESLDF